MNELQISNINLTQGVIEFSNYESVKNAVTENVEKYKNLVVTEDAIQEAKKDRAALNKLSKDLNDKRKEIKKSYNNPLLDFESKIKEIDAIILEAVKNLDTQVREYEDAQKQTKTDEVKAVFDELVKANNIAFITFEQANINVTLSASMKSLKEQAHDFVHGVVSDLTLIDTQEHKERILVEYQRSLNVSQAIQTVLNTVKREEELKQQQIELENQKSKQVEPVLNIVEEPEITAPIEIEEELKLQFTVYGTRTQLKELKQYIESAGLKYDN